MVLIGLKNVNWGKKGKGEKFESIILWNVTDPTLQKTRKSAWDQQSMRLLGKREIPNSVVRASQNVLHGKIYKSDNNTVV